MNREAAVQQIEEPELLTEVPPILKRLAKTVAYAMYEPELIVAVSLLTNYPCIDEDSLLEKLHFDKRQLRQVLAKLKNEKLIKQRVIKEKQQDSANFNVYNFYFINYKLFVNAVKYKLDHIRRKLENEEQQARNRPSFQCQQCEKHYSDLEVDRLLDFETGQFKCTFCSGPVEEDASHINTYSSGSSLGRFNEQMETIFKLLRECENINLAPEVLEPTPNTAILKAAQNKSSSGTKSGWSTDQRTLNIYEQSIQINVGDEIKEKEVAAPKELPLWMSKSTVFNEDESNDSRSSTGNIPSTSQATNERHAIDDSEIMSDLLAHESANKKPRLEVPPKKTDSSSDSEPDSSPEVSKAAIGVPVSEVSETVTEVADMADSDEEEDGHEASVKVGEVSYALSDVTDEVIAKMTEEEHATYLKVYHEAYEQFY